MYTQDIKELSQKCRAAYMYIVYAGGELQDCTVHTYMGMLMCVCEKGSAKYCGVLIHEN